MIKELIAAIRPLDADAMEKCQTRLDNLTKPLGSLHGLELLAKKIAGITRTERPSNIRKTIILMAADHGVAAEGVSAYSQQVTREMVANVCRGGAAINVFARHVGADLVLVDVGIAADLPELSGLRREKVAYGTANMIQGAAMTRQQALRAIEVGVKVVREELAKGVNVIGLGEMGIGNTSSSTAIISCYADRPVEELAGCGTGISRQVREHKVQVIEQALAINSPDPNDPLDVLAKIGGFEIAGLVGVILGAAAGGAAVVVDGVVTSAAAIIAVKIAPQVRDYLIGSHLSVEPGHKIALELMGLPAYLYLDMRLGEGNGAALGISLIGASLHVLNDMKKFGEAEVAVAQDGPGSLRQRIDL